VLSSYVKNSIKTPQQLGVLLHELATKHPKTLFSTSKPLRTSEPIHVAVTGAAGQIAYSLLPRIASGEFLRDAPIVLHLIEVPQAMDALKGVVMELEDCAFPNVKGIVATSDINEGFKGVEYAFLVGSKPRVKGMERADLLKENGEIFAKQGKALNENASNDCQVLVVGNPANTNCLIAASQSTNIPKENFTALTRLDHDRGLAQISKKLNCKITDIDRFAIWGNHSSTQYPDITHATVDNEWIYDKVNGDDDWVAKTFIPTVQNRGFEIIAKRGKSSAASAANAALRHLHDLTFGNPRTVSMGIATDGSNGQPAGIYSSFPVTCIGQNDFNVFTNIPHSDISAKSINASNEELWAERKSVEHLL